MSATWLSHGARFYVFALMVILLSSGQSNALSLPSQDQVACPRSNPLVKDGTLIDQLWKRNCGLVDKFLNNAFVIAQAEQNGQGTFESFQYYSVQDYYYLVETVPFKEYLLRSDPSASERESITKINETTSSLAEDIEYADDFRRNLTSQLSIPDFIINNGTFQTTGLGYVKWLQTNTDLGWFAYQVSRIACLYGWAEIANSLNQNVNTQKTSIFYKEWIQLNSDWSYGSHVSEELQKAVDSYNNTENFEVYNRLFREGMAFEIAFFTSAVGKTLTDTVEGA